MCILHNLPIFILFDKVSLRTLLGLPHDSIHPEFILLEDFKKYVPERDVVYLNKQKIVWVRTLTHTESVSHTYKEQR